MAPGLAALVAVAVVFAAAPAQAGAVAESYYAAVENRLPGAGGMLLVCRALGSVFVTEFSVVPSGRVPRGGRRVAEFLVRPGGRGAVLCSWSYQGNYAANLRLLDTSWPEAARCQDPAGGMCRVVFEGGTVRVETPDGGGRVLGDLPVKRCRRHWLLFSTACWYPDHPNPYAGRPLANAFEFFGV